MEGQLKNHPVSEIKIFQTSVQYNYKVSQYGVLLGLSRWPKGQFGRRCLQLCILNVFCLSTIVFAYVTQIKWTYLLFWLETILPNIRLETNQIMTWMLLLSNIDSRPMIAKKCDCKSLPSLASWNCLAANCLSGHQHCWSTKYPQGNLTFKLWSSKGEGAQKESLIMGPYY